MLPRPLAAASGGRGRQVLANNQGQDEFPPKIRSRRLVFGLPIGDAAGAERFYNSLPGPSLSYALLSYGQENVFFAEQGLDLKVLVVRGMIGPVL